MTWDQLKSYHSDRADALCPGHPEREHEGIEVRWASSPAEEAELTRRTGYYWTAWARRS